MTDRRVIMIQQGARRNYVYAQQLESAGLLHTLATDAAWADGMTGPLAQVLRTAAPRRRVTGVPPERMVSSPLPNALALAKRFAHEERVFPLVEEGLAMVLKARGLRGADVVVNYLGNGGSFLDYAKRRGARIVTDFIITPRYLEIEDGERRRWPGWEPGAVAPATIAFYRRRMARLVALSDFYLCPSETVARDLATLDGFDPARVRLVPYGISGVLLRASRTTPGRVLFAGAAGLRKGLPYLAEAARLLREEASIEVVIAGAASDEIRARPETQALTFLGKLGREAMAEEFARADVFCLPSLAEGSATVVFEALANGVPVVTTSSSGSVIRDGIDGLLVPERDGPALAAAIRRIVGNRVLRGLLAAAGKATAERFSDTACGERFIAVVREALAAGDAPAGTPQGMAME